MNKRVSLLYNACNNYQIAYERWGFEGYSQLGYNKVVHEAEVIYDIVLKLLSEEGFELSLGK